MIKPRYYQQDACSAVIKHVKKRLSPCLLDLATGAGKSIIVTMLAKFFADVAPTKKVICIAPSKELVEQNAEKYRLAGGLASIYCASAGAKCFKNQVIFASPQSLVKNVDQVARAGISAIIIDEAHNITNTLKTIIDKVANHQIDGVKINEKVRVVGMSATPYRTSTGYIYSTDATQAPEVLHGNDKAIEPFFNKLIYRLTTKELIDQGFLTPVTVGITSESYDTSKLEKNKMGRFTSESLSDAIEGKECKTSAIIHEVLNVTTDSKGVLIFATTISHADEIAEMLPANQTRVITGKLGKKDRNTYIDHFKKGWIKYLVNVDVLTTGFDAPHVDCVAILRPTESAGLFQQIIGRGLRLADGKETCLVLDYAENIKRHGLESDLFTPEIKAKKKSSESSEIDVTCPACKCTTSKKKRNDDQYFGLMHDSEGYFLIAGTERATRYDENGQPVEWQGERLTMQVEDPTVKDEFGECGYIEIPVPAHYARRCNNPELYVLSGKPVPCTHRYSFKICKHCNSENDIAARHCVDCKNRLVDPNKKLTLDASRSRCESEWIDVIHAKYEPYTSRSGNASMKVTYATDSGNAVQYITKSQHWHFNKICRANGFNPSLIDAKYDQCLSFIAVPQKIRVSKSGDFNAQKLEVKEIGNEFR